MRCGDPRAGWKGTVLVHQELMTELRLSDDIIPLFVKRTSCPSLERALGNKEAKKVEQETT